MKVRVKFTKAGSMKFIGHLDVMRYFQKAFRRCGLDVAYSQGYSPHQLISFAAPLGVGLTSDGEYLDMQLNSMESEEKTLERINSAMNDEIRATAVTILTEDAKNSMSAVIAADYKVSLKDGYESVPDWSKTFSAFMAQDSIYIIKKTKKSEKEENIKPLILNWAFDIESGLAKGIWIPSGSVADLYENGCCLYLKLACGSAKNLKPELVMEAFCQYAGKEWNPFAYQIHRFEVYGGSSLSVLPDDAALEQAGTGQLIPLSQLGAEDQGCLC